MTKREREIEDAGERRNKEMEGRKRTDGWSQDLLLQRKGHLLLRNERQGMLPSCQDGKKL